MKIFREKQQKNSGAKDDLKKYNFRLLVFKIAKLFLKISGERIKRPKKNLKKPIVVTCSSL